MSTSLELRSDPRQRAPCEWPSDSGSIVRQPILDLYGLVHGYELLFKMSSEEETAGHVGPEEDMEAAGHRHVLTILDNLAMFGLGRFTGGLPAFFNCTAEVLTENLVAVLPPSVTVLEIPSNLEMSPTLLSVCCKLKMAGFRLALVNLSEGQAPHPLLHLVDYVKVDSTCIDTSGCKLLRQRLKGAAAAMVAFGIHSQDSYRNARAEGFKYFQGFYFCNPEPLPDAKIPANRLIHFEILRELLRDPLQLNTLCPLVLREPSLVYRVLRLVNSAGYAVRGTVSSIESAIMILGDIAFRRIATLALQCALNSGRPPEILHMALVRARFCAESACLCNLDTNEQYLLGLLSLLPAMLSIPMETIVAELPLRDSVRHALLRYPIHERCLLDWIECHERNEVSECKTIASHFGLSQAKLMQCYVDALMWDAAELALLV